MKCRCRAVSHQRIGCDNYSDTRGNQGKARWMIIDEAFDAGKFIEFLQALIQGKRRGIPS